MPYHLAMELALTGEPMSAERFHELGRQPRLRAGGALETALELAGHDRRNGPLALAASKRILASQQDWTLGGGTVEASGHDFRRAVRVAR